MNEKFTLQERTVRVIDDSDRDWKTTGHQQLMSLNEAGDVPGHYMYVDGKSVLTNAISTNQKSKPANIKLITKCSLTISYFYSKYEHGNEVVHSLF